MEDENPISKEADLSPELIEDISKTKKNKKKIIIISSIVGISLLLLILIIIIIFTKNKKDDKEKDEHHNEPKEIIGEINCIYDVYTKEESIKLLNDEFKQKIKLELIIDGKNLGFIHEYKFNQVGNIPVKINIYENINMDQMFKEIDNLLEIEIISIQNKSNTKCEILSMQSTFEGCKNLNRL